MHRRSQVVLGYKSHRVIVGNRARQGLRRPPRCAGKRLVQHISVKPAAAADSVAFAVERNNHRRHLTEGQRVMVAANLANLRLGDNQHTQGWQICLPSRRAAVSIPQASEMIKVSLRLVRDAFVVAKRGTQEETKTVDSGAVAISSAGREIRRRIEGALHRRFVVTSQMCHNITKCSPYRIRRFQGMEDPRQSQSLQAPWRSDCWEERHKVRFLPAPRRIGSAVRHTPVALTKQRSWRLTGITATS